MSPFQLVLTAAELVVMPVILGGLAFQRLYRLCYVLPGYILAVWAGELMIFAWPQRFYTWQFWVVKETAYAALKLAMALELGAVAFAAFPGARNRANILALLVLLATLGALAFGPLNATTLASIAIELQPRLANGTALLFASVWALVFWYHIPLHRLHRAILRGFVPYLLVFTAGFRVLASVGFDFYRVVGAADASAYLLMLSYWAWEAWRREPEDTVSSSLMARLQPWRDRL